MIALTKASADSFFTAFSISTSSFVNTISFLFFLYRFAEAVRHWPVTAVVRQQCLAPVFHIGVYTREYEVLLHDSVGLQYILFTSEMEIYV